jgi:3-phosphoshikimate 1-carboxyvinyltransferase
MTVTIHPGRIEGHVRAPPSKSHTHRAFILAALCGNGSVHGALASNDTKETLAALQALGLLVSEYPHETRVGGTLRAPRAAIPLQESGTTLRLIAGTASLLDREVTIEAGPRLRERPMQPLLAAMQPLGVKSVPTPTGYKITGPLRGGTTSIAGDLSSQFVSSLLLAAPLAREETRLQVVGAIASRPYVDVTLAQLAHHGVRWKEEKGEFLIPGGQKVRQKPYTVPGDYSSAAFLLAAAAISGGHVVVDNLPEEDPQGDRAIVELLRAFGAQVSTTADSVEVTGGRPLQAIDVDVGATPDLFPILCALAAVAQGTSQLRGAPQLRHKESDRIHAMATNLRRAGIVVDESPDGIQVRGGIPKGISIESFNDHRVAMALSVLALKSQGASKLPDENVVAKSYPNFLNDLQSLAAPVARP